MQIESIIINLRNRIADFRKSELYEKSKPLRFDINAIEIAVNLSSLGIDNNRAILKSEEYWFEGGYLIANDLTGQWEDISIFYNKLVEAVKASKFFRS
ncbi:MAG: hypothetical protein J0H29_11335 [Sphingobacteriales bacterium]|nr:hypothetical protein [Sphingobacteriales bacterium]OJY90354.1 MAG: hypothetical protein BGP14_11835 [Sphingobacteriales bacterium 44-15]